MKKIKLLRITTVPMTLNLLLKNQLIFLSNYFDILAVSSPGLDLEIVKDRENVPTFPINMSREFNLILDIKSFFLLLKLFRLEKPDIVHANTPKASLLSMCISYILRIKIRVYTIGGLRFESEIGIKRKILICAEKLTCYFSTHILCESIGVLEKVQLEKISKKKLYKLSPSNLNGVNESYWDPNLFSNIEIDRTRNKFNLTNINFVFIYVGRIIRDKGIFELLNAFIDHNSIYINSRLFILGDFELSDADRFIFDELCYNNRNIHIHGFMSDFRFIMAISNCLILPSYREGFPNVVLEAGCMGLPVIMTKVNGSEEYINAFNGIKIEIANTYQLFESMNFMIKEFKLYNKALIRDNTIKNFSSKLVYESLLEFYNEQLNLL
jgi:glycosyltransferase involved in cell wall biosynthesis